jgi:hypothetical protein
MPNYPKTVRDGQELAAGTASTFGNFQCVECAKEILRAIGPAIDAEVIKLRCSDVSDLILLPFRELLISRTGHHVGVRVGSKVFDTHHHAGAHVADWPPDFIAATGAALEDYRMPIRQFFRQRLLARAFNNFASSRREET